MSAAHPAATVTLWAEDEHRLGWFPVRRRVWAPQGQRPLARVERHDEWRSVSGFVRPSTGARWWCLLPTVNTAAKTLALATFARDEGIDATHRAVLVVDRAGWHVAHDLPLPAGMDLVFLPAASPALPPAERLWTLVDEPVVNQAFPATLPEIVYGPDDAVCIVTAHGSIQWQRRRVFVSRGLVGEPVGVRPTTEDGVWHIYYCLRQVAIIDRRVPNEV